MAKNVPARPVSRRSAHAHHVPLVPNKNSAHPEIALQSDHSNFRMPILRYGIPQKLSRTSLVRAPVISRSTRHLFTQSTPVKHTPIRTGLYTTVFVLSAGVFAVYYFDARSALHRYILTPILRNTFDPETGHKIAVKALKSGLSPRDPVGDDERLKAQVISVLVFTADLEIIFLC